MKTKSKRFGKSAVAMLLSAVMVVSAFVVGSPNEIKTSAAENAVVSEQADGKPTEAAVDSPEVKELSAAAETANTTAVSQTPAKKTLESSGDGEPLAKSNTTILWAAFTSSNDEFFKNKPATIHMWNSYDNSTIEEGYDGRNNSTRPPMTEITGGVSALYYFKPNESNINDNNTNNIYYGVCSSTGAWISKAAFQSSGFTKYNQYVCWRYGSNNNTTNESFSPIQITSLDYDASSLSVDATTTFTIKVDGGLPKFYGTTLKDKYSSYDDMCYKLKVEDATTGETLYPQIDIKYEADGKEKTFDWTPSSPNVHKLKFTLTDYNGIDKAVYFPEDGFTVAGNESYSGISVKKAKLYSDASTSVESTEPTVTVDGEAYTYETNFDVEGSVAITAQDTVAAGGKTYKFVKWVDNKDNEVGTNTTLTYVPNNDGDSVTPIYHQCYSITCETAANGKITADDYSVPFGETYTITASPDSSAYVLKEMKVNGTAVTVTDGEYSHAMPSADITVTATFISATVRIYFYDTNNWGQTWIYYDGGSSASPTWPGIMMTPDPTYYNLYYADLPYDCDATNLIFNNKNSGSGTIKGGQTWGITIPSVASKDNQVLVCGTSFTWDNSESINKVTAESCEWKTLSTVKSTATKISTNTYDRIYFVDKAKLSYWDSGIVYVMYGTLSNDTVTWSNYRFGNQTKDYYPGKALTPIEGNNNYSGYKLYYVDIPKTATCISFNRGYWDSGANATKVLEYNSSNQNNHVFALNSGDTDADGKTRNDGRNNRNFALYLQSFNDDGSYRPSVAEQVLSEPDAGEVTVYAKTGTVRDEFDKYARLAEVSVAYTGEGTIDTGDWAYDYKYYDSSDNVFYKVEKANIRKNEEFKATITIKEDYRSKYYVEAFIVNGKTVYPSSDSDTENGQYICKYTISDTESTPIEITPVYFYKTTAATEDNYITFYVEDYEAVKARWGNTLCCYAWYDNDDGEVYAKSDPTDSDSTKKPTLGGYPGQPMIYRDGSHYTQIPVEDDADAPIMGVTLNNLYWDDVHRNFASIDAIGGTRHTNCQTYDYDDFASLAPVTGEGKINTVENIIFTFKYGYANRSGNASGNVPATYAYTGNEVTSTTTYALGDTGVVAGNGYEALTDYYQYPIDLFGKRLVKASFEGKTGYNNINNYIDEDYDYLTGEYVKSNDCVDKLTVVSDGYVTAEHDYIGYLSTKWYVYDKDGAFRGALPPSAFYREYNSYAEFLSYSPNANTYKYTDGVAHVLAEGAEDTQANNYATDDAWQAWVYYKELKASYSNKPVVITYETDIQAGARVVRTGDNAWRCDGRWFFSVENEPIKATVIIEVGSYGEGNAVTYALDTPAEGTPYKGSTTTAEAYFTNELTEKPVSVTTTAGNGDFTFHADLTKIVPPASGTGASTVYKFQGWYYTNGSSTYSKVTDDVDGSKAKMSNAKFIARYLPVQASGDEVTIAHMPYTENAASLYSGSPDVGNGTGTTSVKVRILDASGNQMRLIDKTTGLATLTKEELAADGATYLEVTLYNDDNDDITAVYRDTGSAYQTIYAPDTTGNTGDSESIKNGSGQVSDLTTDTRLKYVYNISDFLLSNGDLKSDKKVIYYYSNYGLEENNITLTFKYYDRKLVNGQEATIDSDAKTLDYTITVNKHTNLSELITNTFNTPSVENGLSMSRLNNVLDTYSVWTTQTEAEDNYANQPYYKLGKYESGDNKGEYKTYSEVENFAAYKPYHTNYLSAPQTTGDTWIVYKDKSNETIDVDTTKGRTGSGTEEDPYVYNDNVDPMELNSITVWAFNKPKMYTLHVYTDEVEYVPTGEGSEATTRQFKGNTLKLVSGTEGTSDAMYTFLTTTSFTGFYNQRVGEKDAVGTKVDGKDYTEADLASNYLKGYFGISEDNGTLPIAYTGEIVDAPTTATAIVNKGKTDEKPKTMKFDGWYVIADDGSFEKISSDRVYGNRITGGLTMYAMYKESPATGNTFGGATVTKNGVSDESDADEVDIFLKSNNGENQVQVRLNSQLNTYYNGSTKDNDSNIKAVSVIYVRLNDADITTNEEFNNPVTGDDMSVLQIDNIAGIKAWLETNSPILDDDDEEYSSYFERGSSARKSGWINIGTEDDKIYKYVIVESYNLPDNGSLSGKNRVQFVLTLSDAQYESEAKYKNLIAFVAVKYDDGQGGSEDKWYVSDNYVSFAHD